MNNEILEQHLENMRLANADMRSSGVCQMHSPHQDGSVPAEYVWYCRPGPGGVGNEIPLCMRCCAMWRANAAEDPDLAPFLIRGL